MDKSIEQRVKEHLSRSCGFGVEDTQELYGLGCRTVLATRNRLGGAFLLLDMREMEEASHMLKGALFNMGLNELGEMARQMEQASKAGRIEEARAVFQEIDPVLDSFE